MYMTVHLKLLYTTYYAYKEVFALEHDSHDLCINIF